jgi:hypothetical protein
MLISLSRTTKKEEYHAKFKAENRSCDEPERATPLFASAKPML